MGKRQNKVEQYKDALRLLKKYGIHVMGAFIFGFDADDESVFSTTLEFALRSKMALAQFSALTPYRVRAYTADCSVKTVWSRSSGTTTRGIAGWSSSRKT